MSVTVYGASDDLIEVDGDIREEFTCPAADVLAKIDAALAGGADEEGT